MNSKIERSEPLSWRKSSYSSGNGGQCVEIADASTDVLVRDSKRPDGAVLVVGRAGWAAFVRIATGG